MDTRFGYEGIQRGIAIVPTNAAAGTITGDAIERSGFQGDCTFTVMHGVVSGSPSAYTVNAHVEESADNSTWTDVDLAADVADGDDAIDEFNDDSTTEGIQTLRIKLENRMKYLRMVMVVGFTGGSSPKVPVAATFDLSGARELPVTQPT